MKKRTVKRAAAKRKVVKRAAPKKVEHVHHAAAPVLRPMKRISPRKKLG